MLDLDQAGFSASKQSMSECGKKHASIRRLAWFPKHRYEPDSSTLDKFREAQLELL